ncbi:MAG: hypothetical protein LBN33_05715 [Desulfovibrio sp.]|jgi:hypothetical protein|nr:hypothetical protein [Desulfovibrio sp.]
MSLEKKMDAVTREAEKREREDGSFRSYKEMADFLDENFPPVIATPQTAPYSPGLKMGRDILIPQGGGRIAFLRS